MKLKSPLYIVCLLFHVYSISLIAQISEKQITKDKIKQTLEQSEKAFLKQTKKGTEDGIYLLKNAEDLAKKLNDPYSTILVNREKIGFFIKNGDSSEIKKCLSENLSIINRLGDKRQLALYYEDIGVYKNYLGKMEESHQAMLMAEKIFNQYGETEDLIDVNYNMSVEYMRRKEWKTSLGHALKSLEAINKTGAKENRKRFLYLFLAEDYINLGEFEKAKQCFLEIEKKESMYFSDTRFKGKFFEKKGFYYEKLGDYKNAASFYEKSSNSFFDYHTQKTKKVSASLVLSGQLNLQEEENKRIKIENELKEQELSNRNYIMLLCFLMILGLAILSTIQYNISKYKSRINTLLKNNYKELIQANKKADKALEVKSEFLDSVTHELLTPLNTIKGTTFLLQKEPLTVHQISQIKLINVSSDYLLNLINDVIQLNDLENEYTELKNEEFDLKSLINNLIDSSLVIKKNNENKIHREIDNGIPDIIKGDMLKISQVVLSVLDNALKFTKNGDIYIKVAVLSTVNNKAKVKFTIQDTGIGMTEKQIEKAFEAFHQGSIKINREYGGTGLGLSIVKRILKLYDSDIIIESKPNKGTLVAFTVDFEIYKKAMDKNVFKKNHFNKSGDELSKDLSVLLVEDNKVNQLITKKIISDYGISCESANDGEEAVDMARKNDYSMIFMDIMMPKMDGFEATKYIRKFNTKVPIIALTALSEKLNKEKFNEAGIYTILSKPVNPELLYKTIKKYCAVLD